MAKKGGNTVDLVTEIVKPIVEQLGLSLWDVRFVKEMEQRGGAEALRGLWKRRRLSPWFDALAARGRLELSPEAIAIQSKYGALFTDDEVNECFSALLEAGWRIG